METKSIEGIAAENHKCPLPQTIRHLTGMAIKQLITAQRLTGTLRACLCSPQLSAKDLGTVPQAKHSQRFWLKTSPAGYYALMIPSFLKYQSCRWIYFLPKKHRKDYHKQQHKSVTAATLQLHFIFQGWGNHLSANQTVPFPLVSCYLNITLLDLLKKKLNERMPKLTAATTAPPQEHAVGVGDSWQPKTEWKGESNFPMESKPAHLVPQDAWF